MEDDDFLNIVETPTEEKGEVTPITSPNIIERTMHTITIFRIYPNGQLFIAKSQSWMDKKGTIIREKEKKKPIKAKETILQKEEVY